MDPARKYRLTAKVKRNAYDSGDAFLYVGFICLKDDYTKDNNIGYQYRYCAASNITTAQFPVGDYVTFTSPIITGVGTSVIRFGTDTAFIRPLIFANYGSGTNFLNEMHLSEMYWEDVTDLENLQANIDSEAVARTDADAAIAATVNAVQTTAGNNASAINAETVARTDADAAIASDVTRLVAAVGSARVPINPNADFNIGFTSWINNGTNAATATAGITTGAADTRVQSQHAMPVDTSETYKVSIKLNREAVGVAGVLSRIYVGLRYYDENGGGLSYARKLVTAFIRRRFELA